MKLTFKPERETKNTIRFEEVGKEEELAIGYIYVRKDTLKKMGHDGKQNITVEVTVC